MATFVIALFDEDDHPTGTTVHTLTDEGVWSWLQRIEEFPEGVEAIEVPIPHTDVSAYVTRWEPTTDKAIHLVCLPGTGRAHPLLSEVQFDVDATDGAEDCDSLYRRLCAEVGADRVFRGAW